MLMNQEAAIAIFWDDSDFIFSNHFTAHQGDLFSFFSLIENLNIEIESTYQLSNLKCSIIILCFQVWDIHTPLNAL